MAVILSALIAAIAEIGASLAADAAFAEAVSATVSTITSAAESIGVTNVVSLAEFVGASEETVEAANVFQTTFTEVLEGNADTVIETLGEGDRLVAQGAIESVPAIKDGIQAVGKGISYGKAGIRGVRAGYGKLRGEESEGQ